MIIMSKKQLQKFYGKKQNLLWKHNGEMKISHNYQKHSRKINFHWTLVGWVNAEAKSSWYKSQKIK